MSYNTSESYLLSCPTSGSINGELNTGRLTLEQIQTQLNTAGSLIDNALSVQSKQQLPLAVVPSSVLDAERVIATWFIWEMLGFDPATQSAHLARRYFEIMGDPEKPDSGWLGQLAFGRRQLVGGTPGDVTEGGGSPQLTTTMPSYRVTSSSGPRRWYARSRNRRTQIIN